MEYEPQIGDIVLNNNPYDGESPLHLISLDKDNYFKCAKGLGKYNKEGWDYEYCELKPKDVIAKSYNKIGFVGLN